MPDPTTYSLSDFVLFSAQTYFRQFELHNQAVWPSQLVTAALGLGLIWAMLRHRRVHGLAVGAGLAACWLWVAWAFHFQRYADINWAAPWFGWAFVVQTALLLISGAIPHRLETAPGAGATDRLGAALLTLAVVLYPFLAPITGRAWAGAEVFGVAPDPTAIGTLAVALAARERTPWELIPIPVLWCLVTALLGVATGTPVLLVPAGLALIALTAFILRGRGSRVTPAC